MELNIDFDKQPQVDEIKLEKNGITLYNSAYNKLAKILELKSDKLLRITLEPGGCAGLSYKAILDNPLEEDLIVEFDDKVKLLVSDKKRFPADDDPSLLFSDWDFLEGLHLRYEESIMQSQFIMENPNAVRGCSCGISFKPRGYGGKPKSCL
jgi:iron-sulfur cluster assembly accessory protein